MTYQPPMREIAVRALTTAGWISGTLVVPERHALLDHVQSAAPFLHLTDARLGGWDRTVPFFALERGAVLVIVPGVDPLIEAPGTTPVVDHQTLCLFDHVSVSGRIRLVKGTRLSSYLGKHGGFFPVHDAELRATGGERGDGAAPVVLVNAARLVGVVDSE